MRVTISALGLELDITFGPATDDTADEDQGAALNGGTLGSSEMVVGFTRTWLGETGIEGEIPEDGRRP
jgi:hypothetical protein